jgi:hypothetical protein
MALLHHGTSPIDDVNDPEIPADLLVIGLLLLMRVNR